MNPHKLINYVLLLINTMLGVLILLPGGLGSLDMSQEDLKLMDSLMSGNLLTTVQIKKES